MEIEFSLRIITLNAIFILLPIIFSFISLKQKPLDQITEKDKETIRKSSGDSKELDAISFMLGLFVTLGVVYLLVKPPSTNAFHNEFLSTIFVLLLLFYWGFIPSIFLHRSKFKERAELILNYELNSGKIIKNYRSKVFSVKMIYIMTIVTLGLLWIMLETRP